jgi:streptogramin lyase
MAMKRWYGLVGGAMAVLLIACTVAVVVAVTTPWPSPAEQAFDLAREPAQADLDYGSNGRLEPLSIDANVEFPKALAELPGPPTHLAVDSTTGDLWFVVFTYNGKTNDLYHYDPSDETLEVTPIPADSGSEFFSAIAVDHRRHVISAEGDVVVDIDPAGGYKEFALPSPSDFAKQPGWDGTYVIDMALSDDGKAYLTRMNSAAITELDLESGASREIPLDPSLGQFYFIELAGDELWMTSWVDTEVATAQTVALEPKSGVVRSTSVKSSALAALGDRSIYASNTTSPGLSRFGPQAFVAESMPAVPDTLSGAVDFLVADKSRDRIWMWGEGAGGIGSLDASTQAIEYYSLPSWDETQPASIPVTCQRHPCPYLNRGAVTRVGGMAVAPNGDLLFSDMSFNRIGIIHPR